MSMTVEKLEEQWTPTTIQAAFVFYSQSSSSSPTSHSRSPFSSSSAFYSQPSSPSPCSISVNLPLLNLGWTFALSLTQAPAAPASGQYSRGGRSRQAVSPSTPCSWIPAAFSFRQHGSTIPWRNTSMHAQLSLAMEQPKRGGASEECTPGDNIGSNSTPLGTMEVVLAHTHTHSTEVPLTTSCTLSSLRPTKVSLIVTISECPFTNGFFQAVSSQFNDTETPARLVRQNGDRLLNRSLTTGKLFDVKFLTRSTRSTSGNAGRLFETYASLPVLQEHVDLSPDQRWCIFKQRLADDFQAKLGEEWSSALAALDHRGNADAKHVREILCPDDYEYELDSDFEDEDEASPPVELCGSSPPDGRNLVTLGESTERSSNSLSSYELGGASDQGSFDHLHEDVIKGPGEPTHLSSVAAADHERTFLVGFAAHRTWYAFVWYCYTGRLEFSKLKSQVKPGARPLSVTRLEDGPPSCSPKSMYRLADLIDNKTLKAKALEAIRERMTEVNVLDEIFSVFTSKYPDVREVQLSALMKHGRSPGVKTAFLKSMSKFSSMPHAEPVLSAFYDRLLPTATLPTATLPTATPATATPATTTFGQPLTTRT